LDIKKKTARKATKNNNVGIPEKENRKKET
jgi:hypothetical protein